MKKPPAKNSAKAPAQKVKVAPKPAVKDADLCFITDSKVAVLAKRTPFANLILYVIALFLVVFFLWAHFATLDEITRGEGRVVPLSQIQIIQNLEGGILKSVMVSEGETVKQDQVLAKLDDTRFASEYNENRAKYLSLEAKIARLEAETKHVAAIKFPSSVLKLPGLVEREQNLFKSRTKSFTNTVGNLKNSYALVEKELKITRPLVKKGVMSKIELLRLEREANSLKSKIDEQQDKFYQDAERELTTAKADEAALAESLLALQDRKVRTEVLSPVDGIVKQIYINTKGGVVKPGMPIMEIVPLNDKLLIEDHVKPTDIAFIHPGQKAIVKVTAYDYAIYGGLEGKVKTISADTSKDDNGHSYYEVSIETHQNYIGSEAHPLPIIPGMTASVDILTGKKTVLAYLLKPILRAKANALRER